MYLLIKFVFHYGPKSDYLSAGLKPVLSHNEIKHILYRMVHNLPSFMVWFKYKPATLAQHVAHPLQEVIGSNLGQTPRQD